MQYLPILRFSFLVITGLLLRSLCSSVMRVSKSDCMRLQTSFNSFMQTVAFSPEDVKNPMHFSKLFLIVMKRLTQANKMY